MFYQPKIGRSHAPIAVTHECEGTQVTKNSGNLEEKHLASLKLTASLPLKMDGWKMKCPFGARPISVAFWLVSDSFG